jgi:hypothetical protein
VDVVTVAIVGIGSLGMGVLGGLLGVGGGVFLVPWLVMAAGVDPHAAVGVSLLCVIGTSAASSFVAGRSGTARLDVALRLEPFLVVGAVLASLLGGRIGDRPLLLGFAGLIVLIAVLVVVRTRLPGPPHAPGEPMARGRLVATLAFFSGAASGLFGVGGGVLVVPALVLAGRMPLKEAATTSSLCLMTSAAAAGAVHAANGALPLDVVGLALVGVLPGGVVGARLQPRVPDRVLEVAFVILAFVVAAMTIHKALDPGGAGDR